MQVGDKEIQFDPDGFMIDPQLWNDEVAKAIAGDEGIDDMTEDHWKIVNFIRKFWSEHDRAPEVRLICQELGMGSVRYTSCSRRDRPAGHVESRVCQSRMGVCS